MSNEKTTILGCPIDALTLAETVALVDRRIGSGGAIRHAAVDAGKLAAMHGDRVFAGRVAANDVISADGQSLVWISRLYGRPLPERVSDVDLMLGLIELAHRRRYRIFLLGNKERPVARAAEKIARRFTADIVAGCGLAQSDGDYEAAARQIAHSKPHMLFAGLGSPQEEDFFCRYHDALKDIPFRTGVGEAFSVIAGDLKRPPVWMRRMCLEWFFRFIQNPVATWRSEVVESFRFLRLIVRDRMLPP